MASLSEASTSSGANEPSDLVEPPTKRRRAESIAETQPAVPEDVSVSSAKKIFNDSVHGHIEVHPLLVSIIDTPQFQRLRFIKLMGMCYFVYPGAAHNVFEHSLGVSHLAGKLARRLANKQKELGITEEDILCVEIAGLCLNIGHAPFGKLFQEAFTPRGSSDYKEKISNLSVKMFEHMMKENQLEENFKMYGLEERDITFVKEQISGTKGNGKLYGNQNNWTYQGRGADKSFLYEIVANKRNCIDIQKWDHVARDTLYLGIPNPFDWKRFLKFARVLEVENEGMQICTRDKEITSLYDMFHAGYTLDRRAYQHRVTNILEDMMVEALVKADGHPWFQGANGEPCKMSKAIDDMVAYTKMTDNIMWTILSSNDNGLQESKEIIERIVARDLFVCVAQTQLKRTVELITPEKWSKLKDGTEEIDYRGVEFRKLEMNVQKDVARKQIYDKLSDEAKEVITEKDLVVQIVCFSYGMGEDDPVEKVKFYSKYETHKPIDEKELVGRDSMTLPREFADRFLRVCVKQGDEQILLWVMSAFEEWCKREGYDAKPGQLGARMSPTRPPHRERNQQVGKAKGSLFQTSKK